MHIALDSVAIGATVTVVPDGILHHPEDPTARRLLHQGVVAGARLTVIQRTAGGGRTVSIGRSRVALDPTVVGGILVEPQNEPTL